VGSTHTQREVRTAPGEQYELLLDWGREPWAGRTPRSMTRGACVVDNSAVGWASREALRVVPVPAQYTLFLQGNPSDGS